MAGAGYTGTPLIRKLGIKTGFRILVVDPPSHYWELLGALPDGVQVLKRASASSLDFVHIFATRAAGLERRLRKLRDRIAPTGMIWVSWPKKSSGVATDLTGDIVRGAGLKSRLVDTKVCAVDETWSGLKLVIRVKDRR
jgi:hypothetical protein